MSRIEARRNDALDALVGRTVPGGCVDCNADATIYRDTETGTYVVTVAHDHGCPWLAGVTR
ncbi:hypothetical protein [Tessaracoccus sp. Z1128]